MPDPTAIAELEEVLTHATIAYRDATSTFLRAQANCDRASERLRDAADAHKSCGEQLKKAAEAQAKAAKQHAAARDALLAADKAAATSAATSPATH